MFCKIHPDRSQCSYCAASAEMFDIIPDCSTCNVKNREYEILEMGTGFWSGDYVIVLDPDQQIMKKVSMSRVYDIRK